MQNGHAANAVSGRAAPAIEIRELHRHFGPVRALDGVSLTIRQGEFLSLLGPSGCGKTTLLRIIAGLELPDAGGLSIGGVDMAEVPAYKRPVNTVFQSYALFPHMTVRDNVAFGLRMKRVAPALLGERVERAMNLVQINDLALRRPAQLSGGQKQRVALARALINEPDVLLLDEPLGALDLKLRKQLQVELSQLQRRLGITFIYVTHDQDEALAMSDRIAVMHAGRIEQLDDAVAVYEQPRTRFVAEFLGGCNLIEADVIETAREGLQLSSALGPLRVRFADPDAAVARLNGRLRPGMRIHTAIRPEKIRLARKDEFRFENCLVARIEDLVYRGVETQYLLRAGGQRLHAVALNGLAGDESFDVGMDVLCYLPEPALIPLDD